MQAHGKDLTKCVAMQVENVVVDVALQWCSDAYSDTLVGFANSVKTTDGGSHMDGLKSALTRSLNVMARKSKALKEGDPNLTGDNIREGLGGIIAVKVGLCLHAKSWHSVCMLWAVPSYRIVAAIPIP